MAALELPDSTAHSQYQLNLPVRPLDPELQLPQSFWAAQPIAPL